MKNIKKIWTIYAVGQEWRAWNCREHRWLPLTSNGSFSDAVAELEKKIGPYYNHHRGDKIPLEAENIILKNTIEKLIEFCFEAGKSAAVAENSGDIKEVSDALLGKKWWGIGEKSVFEMLSKVVNTIKTEEVEDMEIEDIMGAPIGIPDIE